MMYYNYYGKYFPFKNMLVSKYHISCELTSLKSILLFTVLKCVSWILLMKHLGQPGHFEKLRKKEAGVMHTAHCMQYNIFKHKCTTICPFKYNFSFLAVSM